MIVIDSLLFGAVRFVLDKVAVAADRELNDEGKLREELLAAQLRLELGEIGEDEFAALEGELLGRLRELRLRREQEAGEPAGEGEEEETAAGEQGLSLTAGRRGRKVIGVEVDYAGEEEPR
ncbi:MAG TPA: gas vesicle protein GvpG [Thermoanaerobaculia bacterium]|nr:gas vesicle protein GvpG [Thermoanaerobaculia bacterium]